MHRKIAFFLSVLMVSGMVYPIPPHQSALASPTALPFYSSLAARNYFTCALTASGGVQCWGDNRFGQLGVGDNLSRSNPVDVVFSDPTVQVSQVATGGYHACALTTTGEAWCWGRNTEGQLGDGTTTGENEPVRVIPANSGIVRLAGGGYHTCALYANGNIQCWGEDLYGQLGDGLLANRSSPVTVSGLGGPATALETGWFHTCAIIGGSGVKCWGLNDDGQLGNNSKAASSTPVSVAGLPSGGFSSLAAGRFHTCALSASGGVWCWGGNDFGQLGDGSTTLRLTAVLITSLPSGVLEIGAGYVHTCARLASGVKCWGSNEFGQLGDNTQTNHSLPAPVASLPASGLTALAVGGNHTCVLASSAAQCWGWNNYGQLGNGSPPVLVFPVPVSGLAGGVSALSGGASHTCALVMGGQVWCWGANGSGQLGDGTTTHRGGPVPVQSLPGSVTRLAAGDAHTCALLKSGGVICWGANDSGQLGSGSTALNSPLPVGVSGLSSGVIDIAAGGSHTCALFAGGGVTCWGNNADGQLGDGTKTNSSRPVAVTGPPGGYIALAAGGYHTCALTSLGTVRCWGDNEHGQLGDGTTNPHLTPTDVPGLSGVVALAAGAYHTCALTSTQQVECWGLNLNGQLGLGDLVEHHTPALVAGLSGVSAITAGAYHTCALLSAPPDAGTVRCWGQNNYFQLGSGNPGDQASPAAVSGLAQGIQAISAGASHTCALVGPGEPVGPGALVCWGWTSYGQLGTLPGPWQLTPVAVTDQQVFLTGFTKFCLKNRAAGYTLLDFASHFSAASGRGLQKIEIDSLPASGSLNWGGLPVTVGQEIEYTLISNLSFIPAADWTGTTSFTWNGSDGSVVSPIVATVTLNVSGNPVYLPTIRH